MDYHDRSADSAIAAAPAINGGKLGLRDKF
jgi:hypothetical protein